ncbi:unnamed protein product [Durusdinium trenchii]|uniref:Uncharacterized protein n=2 Tax=Durusdinium trenchii TaxID=1381693 RepID=A0ABP0SKG7_9DINO
MASLDAFLVRASRLPRLAARSSQDHLAHAAHVAAAGELLRQAVDLLVQHRERAAEIAMVASRLGALAEAAPLEEFANAFGQLAHESLPDGNFSKEQAREALAAYVALEGLGAHVNGLGSALQIASRIASRTSTAVSLLEPQEISAALARLAASRSSAQQRSQVSQVASISKPPNGAFEAAAADVALALQKSLLAKGEALGALSAQDLCNAVVGLARSPLLVPDAAIALASVARSRVSELSIPSLLDFSRALAELAVVQGPQRNQLVECLHETFPLLARVASTSLQGDFDKVGLCLSGLSRLAANLPEESAAAFAKEIISPAADQILDVVCQDEDMQLLEVGAPLLQLDKNAWTKLLRYLALEGLPKLPATQESNSRFISILEWVASKDEQTLIESCPPLFDFAFQELSRRRENLDAAAVRKATKLLANVHLERPDLLPSSAMAIAVHGARAEAQPAELAEVALYLSAMANLYLRLSMMSPASSNKITNQDEQQHEPQGLALQQMAQSFVLSSRTAQDLLTSSNAASDAAFLALSAFAQATCRTSPNATVSVATQSAQLIEIAGLDYLEALCKVLQLNHAENTLSMQQAHIFVTCIRGFGTKGPPPSSILAVLEEVIQLIQQSLLASDQKEVRLCLAVLQELQSDPACPPALKSLLGARMQSSAEPSNDARERLRASMASESPPTPSPAPGFLRRMFGF